ncbi:MAG: hypothetical protein HY057_06210 [Rhodospirillales bacterium]|nr:hypothetical protein [Rhodospirillales bacterium]
MHRQAMVLVSCAALIGCASVEDIRASSPIRMATFTVEYRDLAACAAHRLQGSFPITHLVQERRQLATVTSISDNGFVRMPTYEISTKPVSQDRSAAELRSFKTVWGTPGADADEFWAAVETCGAPDHRAPSQR